MKPHTLFISDLHLEENEPHITNTFLHFLNTKATHTDALYILGDCFEAWIGDDDQNAFNQKIIKALRTFTQRGIPTFFMRGNRDLLISQQFAKQSGVTLLADPTTINLYGEKILITHGDSLCTLDIKHQKFRQMALKRRNQQLFLKIPLFIRKKIITQIRRISQQRNLIKAEHIMDVTTDEVIRLAKMHNVFTLIHGHTHRPATHTHQTNQQTIKRLVLDAWHQHGNMLIYNCDGSYQLENFEFVKNDSRQQ